MTEHKYEVLLLKDDKCIASSTEWKTVGPVVRDLGRTTIRNKAGAIRDRLSQSPCTNLDISIMLGCTFEAARKVLMRMISAGEVVRKREGKTHRYALASKKPNIAD